MYQLSVYYDGLCPLCSKEIEHYRKRDQSKLLRLVDISSPQFDARKEGLDPKDVHKKFHVKTASSNQVITGVDGFVEIWRTLGIFKSLEKLATNKFSRPLFDLGYFVFAKVRPIFRKNECNDNYCKQSI